MSAEELLQSDEISNACCMILDIRLPGMDGMELQRELKRRAFSMPIIFITGHGDKEIEQQVMSEGAHGYLEKPFDQQLLINLIKSTPCQPVRWINAD